MTEDHSGSPLALLTEVLRIKDEGEGGVGGGFFNGSSFALQNEMKEGHKRLQPTLKLRLAKHGAWEILCIIA